jgi:hypothetical protein
LQTESTDVFVSYARVDWRHAADIDSLLRARGLSTFFDRHNLSPGLRWLRGLESALNAAKAAIIMVGPQGLGNTQQYERDYRHPVGRPPCASEKMVRVPIPPSTCSTMPRP